MNFSLDGRDLIVKIICYLYSKSSPLGLLLLYKYVMRNPESIRDHCET